jgi:hypothetical protein
MVTSSAIASGGVGGGNASATTAATSGGQATISFTATATGGAGGTGVIGTVNSGQAFAQSTAQNAISAVTATVRSPSGAAASASTFASVGSGAPTLVPISAGRTLSNATPIPDGNFGAMSVGYGGTGETLTYDAEASESSGSGFDSQEIKIVADGNSSFTFQTQSLAEAFFTDNSLLFGVLARGNQTVDVS